MRALRRTDSKPRRTAKVFMLFVAVWLIGVFACWVVAGEQQKLSSSRGDDKDVDDEESLPYWRREHVVIPALEKDKEKLEAAVAAKKWPSVDWDYRADSGDMVPLEDAVGKSFDRLDFLTGRDSSQSGSMTLSLTECAATANHCGRSCGRFREYYRNACWCVRLWQRSVAYLPQSGLDNEFHSPNTWRSDVYQSLHMSVNLLSATLRTMQEPLAEPLYLVVNVYDYPRLFTPILYDDAPKVTSGHPAEEHVGYDFYSQIAFQGGFPSRLESCQEDQDPSEDECCDTRLQFPIFSWSVNPLFNFDILAPNRHAGSCMEKFFDPEIASVPWEEKTRTVMSRGTSRCHALQNGDHRARFCALVQRQRRFLERALDIQMDIFGGEVDPKEQAQAKYLVLLDGAVAAFRSTWYLSTGSVILAAGTHVDMRTSLLRPYVHFIPFRADYTDFAEALSLVALNDEYAKWVGENARRVGRILSQRGDEVDGGHEGDKLYWAHLLREYQSRYTFVTDSVEIPKLFTMNTTCEDFREESDNRAKSNHCLGEEYACEGKIQDGYLKDKGVQFHDRESEVPPLDDVAGGDASENKDNESKENQDDEETLDNGQDDNNDGEQ